MAKCGAGECSCECKNGCGCIASSDDPLNCDCRCFGGLRAPNFGVFEGVRSIELILRNAPVSQVAFSFSSPRDTACDPHLAARQAVKRAVEEDPYSETDQASRLGRNTQTPPLNLSV